MDTKKPRMKKEQQQYLLNFLMRNPETVNGNCQLPATKRLWTELTEALNGMGGDRKTQKDWLETYKLLARRAKAKMRTQCASMQSTGGGHPADNCLTELEKKTINIEGTSTIYGLPGAVEAGIIIVPGTPQPIVDVPDPYVKQNIVMDIHSDTEEEPPKEAAMVDALTRRNLMRRNAHRATPRTLVPPADSATPQEDAMIVALREGAQAQVALANAQTEAARYLGDCIMRAATMFVEAINKNK
ncbi:unnamed protein product [Parnassius apollo]|uniref:(apollo) hypothetical protein n=1 Tax=Parnassius apollo TaxID=110799 RepID=A0A8S3WE53_PARAO|nr:unnamed protein product [Parnassius apollo]